MTDSHNSQPHDSQPRDSQPHDSQPYYSQPHNSQSHNSQSHKSQSHNSQSHNSRTENSQSHNSQPHKSQPEDSQSYNLQSNNSQPDNSQSHNSQADDSQADDYQQREELLASYVLGDLTPEEVAQVDQLLVSNPELLEEVKHLQETLALLPFALPGDEPPQLLGAQILQAATEISATEISKENSPLSVTEKVSRRQRNWLGSAGTTSVERALMRSSARIPLMNMTFGLIAASFVGLGFYIHNLQQKIVTTRNELSYYQETVALLRQPNNRLLSLKGIGKKFEASGSFVIVPSSGKGVLSLQNLSPLPKDKVYRLWAVNNGEKVDCGDFEVNPQGKALVQLPVDNSMVNISSALVTIEPLKPVSQPTGETVMRGSLL